MTNCQGGRCHVPNVKRLIIRKMVQIAVPAGGDLRDGVRFLTDRERMVAVAREAEDWVRVAIEAVKTAPDNPYGDDDEAIAGEILRQTEARKDRP